MSAVNVRTMDIREYIFALIEIDSDRKEGAIAVDKKVRFLGTGFFVSPDGDGLTAAHILPEQVSGKIVAAALMHKGELSARAVKDVIRIPGTDVATFRVDIEGNSFLEIDDNKLQWGDDLVTIGVPDHETGSGGKEMRILKGHISMITKRWELSMPIPPGMSGSPIFRDGKVVAVGLGLSRGEYVDDYHQEIEEVANHYEKVTIAKVVRVVEYGVAYPFAFMKGKKYQELCNVELIPFIRKRARGQAGDLVAAAMRG